MPTISVIVPVYKVEPYLRRCVDSILAQTFADFELILVDDGSPDNCPAICDEYAAKDSRVRVIHQENGGLSAARNAGIDWAFANSDSQWLSFIDSDDCVLTEYLKVLLNVAVSHQADISICGEFLVSSNNSIIEKRNFEGQQVYTAVEACELIYRGPDKHASFVSSCAKLYKKELFYNVRFPVGRLHEDQFTTYRLMYYANKIVEDGRCMYCYYVNSESITHKTFSVKRYDDIDALDQAIAFFCDHHEIMLAEAATQRRQSILAKYSIMARSAGIYASIPKKFKLSFFTAERTLYAIHGEDYADYFLFKYYPSYIKIKALIRRICRGRRTEA